MKNTRYWSWALIKVVTNSGDCTVNTGENSISEPATVKGGVGWGAYTDSSQRGREYGTAHPQARLCPRCSFSYLIGLIAHLQRVQVYWYRINLSFFVTVEIRLWWGTVLLLCLTFRLIWLKATTRHGTRSWAHCVHLWGLRSTLIVSNHILDLPSDCFVRYFSIKMLFLFLVSESSHKRSSLYDTLTHQVALPQVGMFSS